MANFRQIHTHIWKDDWFLDLLPDEKLFFIYLFSNESTSISGLYKLAFKVMCFESGIDPDRVREILDKFSAQDKVKYADGIVWIVNMRKYHASKSIKIKTRIISDLEKIPDCDIKIEYIYHMDTISNGVGQKGKGKGKGKQDKDEKENEDKEVTAAVVFSYYQNNIAMLNPSISETIEAAFDDYPLDWFMDAIDIAVERNVRNWRYIEGILKNWKTKGKDNGRSNNDQPGGGGAVRM